MLGHKGEVCRGTSTPLDRRGFTIIEILVVIAIIGLLAALVIASLQIARKKSRDARRVADLNVLRNAFELYASDNNGIYPTCNGPCQAAVGVNLNPNSSPLDIPAPFPGIYMAWIPIDPSSSAGSPKYYKYRALTTSASTNTGYCVLAEMERPPPPPPSSCPPGTNINAPGVTYPYRVGF